MAGDFFVTGLPQLPLSTNKELEPDLRDLYNAIRNLAKLVGQFGGYETPADAYQTPAQAAVTAGLAKQRVYAVADEALAYGAAVHLLDSGGTLHARFANATNTTRPCLGFCNTAGTSAIGDMVEILLPGNVLTSIGGLTPGVRYFLDTNNGIITNTPPAVVGNIRELLGFALNSTTFFFFPNLDYFVV